VKNCLAGIIAMTNAMCIVATENESPAIAEVQIISRIDTAITCSAKELK